MDKIAVLDFGGQYAHLIANRIRRMGVYTEILEPDATVDDLRAYKGVILSGGPASVRDPESPKCDRRILELGVPIMGLCYGHQLIAHYLDGGEVEKGEVREYGAADIKFESKPGIFEEMKDHERVWMSHFDQVVKAPEGFEVVGSTYDCPIAAMANHEKRIYSMQFHPEVTHTPCGRMIFESFINMTHAKREWNMDAYIERILEEIKEHVGDKKVFLMVSGGVDSTVAFMLLDKALGQDRVYGLFVDTGFMRMNEGEEVARALKELGIENLHVYNASEEYFEALKEKYDPEEKRKIIGDLFIDIQGKLVDQLGLNPNEWILGQGTIYPDTIETGASKHAHTIKTHHNRVPRIQELIDQGKVIEPISQLYKDEVRLVGERLGLKKEMVWRHPFPGPGLAIRCLCAEKEEYPEDAARIEAEMNEFLANKGMKAKVLPIRSVGVQGDERSYKNPVMIYGKELDWDELDMLGTRMTNQWSEVNRVVYGLFLDELSEVTTQKSYLNKERVHSAQQADQIVMDYLIEVGIYDDIWQFPTVLLPVRIGQQGKESVVLRPVSSQEAMTASFYRMDQEQLKELYKRLIGLDHVGAVLYDITNKPPGTIEWE